MAHNQRAAERRQAAAMAAAKNAANAKPHVNIYNPHHNHTTAAKKINPAPVQNTFTKPPVVVKKKMGC
jgi:hypothetical protein